VKALKHNLVLKETTTRERNNWKKEMFTSKGVCITKKAKKESLKCQKLDEQTFQMKFDDVWYV